MATTQTQTETRLASPAERPEADVVIYDGHCRICRGQVERLARWDGGGRLAFLSLHDAEIRERYPDLDHDELMSAMYVVDRDGGRHRGAAAIRYLSRRLPRLWWAAPVLHLPGSLPLWHALSRLVAANRYRFGRADACDSDACQIHFRR